jgi:hypothetical protein
VAALNAATNASEQAAAQRAAQEAAAAEAARIAAVNSAIAAVAESGKAFDAALDALVKASDDHLASVAALYAAYPDAAILQRVEAAHRLIPHLIDHRMQDILRTGGSIAPDVRNAPSLAAHLPNVEAKQ